MIQIKGDELKQYELSRIVRVTPMHGHTLQKVRFKKELDDDPIENAFYEENGDYFAEIPNVLLMGFGVLVVETVSLDDSGENRKERATFTVHKRKKPDNYVFTDNVAKVGSTDVANATKPLVFAYGTIDGTTTGYYKRNDVEWETINYDEKFAGAAGWFRKADTEWAAAEPVTADEVRDAYLQGRPVMYMYPGQLALHTDGSIKTEVEPSGFMSVIRLVEYETYSQFHFHESVKISMYR